MPGVMRKLKASSENELKLVVEIVVTCRKLAASRPAAAPTSDSSSASSRNAVRIAPRPKPSARSVPISAVRVATDAYIVMAAPMMAPSEKITDSVLPMIVMKRDRSRP